MFNCWLWNKKNFLKEKVWTCTTTGTYVFFSFNFFSWVADRAPANSILCFCNKLLNAFVCVERVCAAPAGAGPQQQQQQPAPHHSQAQVQEQGEEGETGQARWESIKWNIHNKTMRERFCWSLPFYSTGTGTGMAPCRRCLTPTCDPAASVQSWCSPLLLF